MKYRNYSSHVILASLLGSALALGGLKARGNVVIDTFNDASSADAWTATWGSTPTLSWDAQDAGGSASSGSLRVSADYITPSTSWQQLVITRTFDTPVVGSDYAKVTVDVKVDPSSVPGTNGQYGYFELKRTSDGSTLGGVHLTNTNWMTITLPLSPTEGTLNGIIIQDGDNDLVGPITLNVDNLTFVQGAVTAKPTLAFERNSAPGLKLYASAPNEDYQRQNIVYAPSENLANNLWWVNQPDPMTYSVTWADFPDKNTYRGFQGHIMLIADSGMGTSNPSPDWTDPNVIMIEFQYINTPGPVGTNGTAVDQVLARARFLHKVNQPGANSMLYQGPNTAGLPVGVLAELLAPSMLGTWSLTFQNNTNIVLTAPDNTTTNLTMPAADAALFEPVTSGVSAQFGVQPNAGTPAHEGQAATISNIKIVKGSAVVVDEHFPTVDLDPAKWIVRARDAGGIFVAAPDLAYLLHWNLPDTGFALKASTAVTGPWAGYGTNMLVGAQKYVLINKAALPGANAGFFLLVK